MARTAEEEAAAKAAMRMELGAGRLDELGMDDGEHRGKRTYQHPPLLTTAVVPARLSGSVNSRWQQAIDRGDFNDDDAAMVAGVDSIFDGQLARVRRAAATAATTVEPRHKNIGGKGPKSFSPVNHNGTGNPQAACRNEGRSGRPGHSPGQGGANISVKPGAPLSNDARSNKPAAYIPQPRSNSKTKAKTKVQPARPPARKPPQAVQRQPAVAPSQGTVPPAQVQQTPAKSAPTQASLGQSHESECRDSQPETPSHVPLVLSEGATMILQLPVAAQSSAFTRKGRHAGTILLVEARLALDDMFILSIKEQEISEFKHPISAFKYWMTANSQTGEVMLMFQVAKNTSLYYTVSFGSSACMSSFLEAIGKLQERQKTPQEATVKTITTDQGTIETSQIKAKTTPPEPKSSGHQVEPSKSPLSTKMSSEDPADLLIEITPSSSEAKVASLAQPVSAPSASSTEQLGTRLRLPADIIEEIVELVMENAKHMFKNSPGSVTFDSIRSVIRGTSAAVLAHHNQGFSQLSADQRATIVEEYCSQSVEQAFLAKLAQDAMFLDQLRADEERATPTPLPEDLQPPRGQERTAAAAQDLSQRTRSIKHSYNIDELIRMRDSAVEPPHWLVDLGYLPKADRLNQRHQKRNRIIQWDECHENVRPVSVAQAARAVQSASVVSESARQEDTKGTSVKTESQTNPEVNELSMSTGGGMSLDGNTDIDGETFPAPGTLIGQSTISHGNSNHAGSHPGGGTRYAPSSHTKGLALANSRYNAGTMEPALKSPYLQDLQELDAHFGNDMASEVAKVSEAFERLGLC